MFRSLTAAIVVVTFMAAAPLHAGEKKASPLDKAFAKLKAMHGTWKVHNATDVPADKAIITYRVTAGGSTVMETMFPGTKMEMISMWHRDGKSLRMTHYCMAQNQPRFKARVEKKTGALILDFAGGTNLNPKKDLHVRSGRIQFVDDNTVQSEWTHWVGGKEGGSYKFKLTRVK